MKIVQLTTDAREHYKNYDKPVPYFGAAPEALLEGFAALPQVEVHVVSCVRQPIRSPEKLADNIFYHSVVVPRIGRMKTFYLGCIRAVRKKLREIKPDIVHGQGTELDCAISAVFSGYPNVVTIHGNMRIIAEVNQAKPFSFLWLAARLEAFTIPRSDGIVCITQHTRNAVAGLARRTWIVPNAADPSFFDGGIEPESPPIILCVGTVSALKNQNEFIRALDPLAVQGKFAVHFLGRASSEGKYAQEFFRLLQERRWCSYEGHLERAALRKFLQRASLLVLPSLEDNCPMVVLEAMAMGVPVVAAKVGGVPELIEDGKTGLLFDPRDRVSIRSRVAQVLENPSAAWKLAKVARQNARNHFHPTIIARRHMEIYQEILSSEA